MTPFRIQFLLHYHCQVADFPHLNSPYGKETAEEFLKLGLIERLESNAAGIQYGPNIEALDAYVKALTEVPLPTKRWIVESLTENK